MNLLLFVLMLSGLLYYFLTSEERARVLGAGRTLWQQARTEALRRWRGQPDPAGHTAPPAFATWTIVTVTAFMFVWMRSAAGTLGDPETLVSWGGSFGPRTTNGEWWRLVTATFVHASPLQVIATLFGLVQIGCLTERLVGRTAFAATYLATGTLANLVLLVRLPVDVTVGGAAAVFGVYGLFVATCAWGLLRGSRVRLRWATAKPMLAGVVIFVLYSAITGRPGRVTASVALAGGAISGLLLAKGAKDHRPAARRIAILTADIAAVIVLFAVPLRGMTDVRPEIRRVLAMEEHTTRTYDAEVARFTNGAIRPIALARLIDRAILPDVQAARAALDALERVPRDYQPLVADTREYLRLREESWRLRSEALQTSRMPLLKEADRCQWQAMAVLEKIRDAGRARSRP